MCVIDVFLLVPYRIFKLEGTWQSWKIRTLNAYYSNIGSFWLLWTVILKTSKIMYKSCFNDKHSCMETNCSSCWCIVSVLRCVYTSGFCALQASKH